MAGQGRREVAYLEGTWPTEDAGMRRFAAGQRVRVVAGATTTPGSVAQAEDAARRWFADPSDEGKSRTVRRTAVGRSEGVLVRALAACTIGVGVALAAVTLADAMHVSPEPFTDPSSPATGPGRQHAGDALSRHSERDQPVRPDHD